MPGALDHVGGLFRRVSIIDHSELTHHLRACSSKLPADPLHARKLVSMCNIRKEASKHV